MIKWIIIQTKTYRKMTQKIVEALKAYTERKGGQNKAANSIKGVSSATLSQMAAGNWEHISDEMWRKVARALGVSAELGGQAKVWNTAETATYQQVHALLQAAQEEARVMSLTAPAGSGKTYAAKEYEASHRNVYRLMCDEFWSKNDFVEELLRVMGEKADGLTKRERLRLACDVLSKKEQPLLIFDEFDKLGDNVWGFFITLYNRLEEQCGIVLLSTDYIEKRMRMEPLCGTGPGRLRGREGRVRGQRADRRSRDRGYCQERGGRPAEGAPAGVCAGKEERVMGLMGLMGLMGN